MKTDYSYWHCDGSTPEGVADIIMRLKNDPAFAEYFFYTAIVPMRARIIGEINRIYHIRIDPNDFSTVLFEYLWADGTWGKLSSYSGTGNFFKWLSAVAFNQMRAHLVEMRYIFPDGMLRAENSRLRLLSQDRDVREDVVSLVKVKPLYEFLYAFYVEKKSGEEIMSSLKLNDELYSKTRRAAEKLLKNMIILTDSPYKDMVLTVGNRRREIASSALLGDLSEIVGDSAPEHLIEDFFRVPGEDIHDTIYRFMYDFPLRLGWKESDIELWRSRYLRDERPVDLARKYGRPRSWIDLRYSRLHRRFREAVRRWWNVNNS